MMPELPTTMFDVAKHAAVTIACMVFFHASVKAQKAVHKYEITPAVNRADGVLSLFALGSLIGVAAYGFIPLVTNLNPIPALVMLAVLGTDILIIRGFFGAALRTLATVCAGYRDAVTGVDSNEPPNY